MVTIFIIYKKEDQKAIHILPDIQNLLEQHKYPVQSFCIDVLPRLDAFTNVILLALGGDGTILSLLNHNRIALFPIISINTGTLGFFTTFSICSWYDSLIQTIQTYNIEQLPLLSITSSSYTDIALNEISITRSGIARNIFIQTSINNEELYTFAGDGILVATQYGSSAYSRSAGGSLIHPSIKAHIISPIVPASPALPSLVIPDTSIISIHIEADDATITCDGQRLVPFSNTITIQRAPYTMPFFSFLQGDYYSHIRVKGII